MTERTSRLIGESKPEDETDAVSTFWQERDRYHDLAARFGSDVVITYPDDMSGRHPGCPGDTECCGWCATGVIYYEHVPGARYSISDWH